MSGYANRVVRIGFPELTEPGTPELFITLKNPRVLPPSELVPKDLALDADGKPVDMVAAEQAARDVLARLVIAWRMFDATDFALDEDGNPMDQQPLPLPATPDLVAKLPADAITKLNTTIMEAVNPQ